MARMRPGPGDLTPRSAHPPLSVKPAASLQKQANTCEACLLASERLSPFQPGSFCRTLSNEIVFAEVMSPMKRWLRRSTGLETILLVSLPLARIERAAL